MNPVSQTDRSVAVPGSVFALGHILNQASDFVTPFVEPFVELGDVVARRIHGGDQRAPSGEGFVWYENASTARVNSDVVDMLPPYSVVGLKHSQNQKNKTLVWRDGQTYDPLVGCPDGFDRKDGGDRGASSGTGHYWCEKRR